MPVGFVVHALHRAAGDPGADGSLHPGGGRGAPAALVLIGGRVGTSRSMAAFDLTRNAPATRPACSTASTWVRPSAARRRRAFPGGPPTCTAGTGKPRVGRCSRSSVPEPGRTMLEVVRVRPVTDRSGTRHVMHVGRRRLAWHTDRHPRHRRRRHRCRRTRSGSGRAATAAMPPRFPTATTFDGGFHFCRVMFTQRSPRKAGLEHRLSRRRHQLQRPPRRTDQGPRHDGPRGRRAVPDAVVVRLTDDALFKCPFIFMEDAGTARFTRDRSGAAAGLPAEGRLPARLGLSRHVGTGAVRRGDRPRPAARASIPIVDLTPPDHPIWHTMFQVTRLPQMASINTWRRTGGGTHRTLERRGRRRPTRAASPTRTAG